MHQNGLCTIEDKLKSNHQKQYPFVLSLWTAIEIYRDLSGFSYTDKYFIVEFVDNITRIKSENTTKDEPPFISSIRTRMQEDPKIINSDSVMSLNRVQRQLFEY